MEHSLHSLAAAVAGLGRAALQQPLGAGVPLAAIGLTVALLFVVTGFLALHRRRNSLAASFLNRVLPKAVVRVLEKDVSISLRGKSEEKLSTMRPAACIVRTTAHSFCLTAPMAGHRIPGERNLFLFSSQAPLS